MVGVLGGRVDARSPGLAKLRTGWDWNNNWFYFLRESSPVSPSVAAMVSNRRNDGSLTLK